MSRSIEFCPVSEINFKNRAAVIAVIVGVCLATTYSLMAAGDGKQAKPRRAKPPAWNQRAKSIFFDDLDRALIGPRPNYSEGSPQRPARSTLAGDRMSDGNASRGLFAWSKIISAESIEDEIKLIAKEVDAIVTTPQRYAAGGYRTGQRHFSMLAVMFAIIAEYDGEVRWKDRAISSREMFALTGFGSRVGSIQAFNQAKNSKQALSDLIRGESIQDRPAAAKAKWDKVASRPPLMQRLKQSHQDRLQQWTANAGQFKKQKEAILREAEILAALSEVIQRDGFEFSDDDDYLDYCQRMREASLDVAQAVKLDNPEMARKAVGQIGKICSECHAGYRN